MILGKPKDINNYICVNSDLSTKLCKLGFIPSYREIGLDNIYFIKTEEICEVIGVGKF